MFSECLQHLDHYVANHLTCPWSLSQQQKQTMPSISTKHDHITLSLQDMGSSMPVCFLSLIAMRCPEAKGTKPLTNRSLRQLNQDWRISQGAKKVSVFFQTNTHHFKAKCPKWPKSPNTLWLVQDRAMTTRLQYNAAEIWGLTETWWRKENMHWWSPILLDIHLNKYKVIFWMYWMKAMG